MNMQLLLNRLPETIQLEGFHSTNELYVNGQRLDLKASLRVRNHSPSGFNWGYGGSGPAQSALAILLKYWPKEEAQKHYQAFKFAYIAALPQTDFIKTVPLREIMAAIVEPNPSSNE